MVDKLTTLERRAAFFFDQVIKCASLDNFQTDIQKLLVEEYRSIIRSEMKEILRLRKAIEEHFNVVVSSSDFPFKDDVVESLNTLKLLSEEHPERGGYRNWEESVKPSNPWDEDQPDGNTGVTYGKGNG